MKIWAFKMTFLGRSHFLLDSSYSNELIEESVLTLSSRPFQLPQPMDHITRRVESDCHNCILFKGNCPPNLWTLVETCAHKPLKYSKPRHSSHDQQRKCQLSSRKFLVRSETLTWPSIRPGISYMELGQRLEDYLAEGGLPHYSWMLQLQGRVAKWMKTLKFQKAKDSK